jgi:PPM family protein phosphatase
VGRLLGAKARIIDVVEKTVDWTAKGAGRILNSFAKLTEAAFGLVFGWAMVGPELTPQQAEHASWPQDEQQDVADLAAQRENSIALDWQQFEPNRQQQRERMERNLMPRLAQGKRGAVPFRVTGAMLSHPGCVRDLNEDAVAYVLPRDADGLPDHRLLAVVADGMGGHAAGEVASRIAADTVLHLYNELEGSPLDVLRACMTAANKAILDHARTEPSCAGMGTTCTVLALQDGAAYLAHIGDSRAYLLHGGRLRQISEDHSLVAEMVRQGRFNKEEAANNPERNVILRALGTELSAEPYLLGEGLELCQSDVFILCSDGLTAVVNDETIRDTVAMLPPVEACRTLLDRALAAGGPDNISIGVFALGT